MIEDLGEIPNPWCRDPNDHRPRGVIVPEPRCKSHRKGPCHCEDDGSGADEAFPEDRLR